MLWTDAHTDNMKTVYPPQSLGGGGYKHRIIDGRFSRTCENPRSTDGVVSLLLCLVLVLLFNTLCPSSFAIILMGKREVVALPDVL